MSERPHKHSSAAENSQRASLALEATIVLPVLFAAISSIIVFGVRLSDQMYLTQAARELGVVLSRTPYMAALAAAGVPRTYVISSTTTVSSSSAKSCLDVLTNGTSCEGTNNYSQCTPCAETVAGWYAEQAFQLKKLRTQTGLTVSVRFAAPPTDATASASGLCMIYVSATANSTGWLRYLSKNMTVSHWVPYIGNPVPPAGQSCNDSID